MKRSLVIYIHGVSPGLERVTITPEYIRGDVPPDLDRAKRIGHGEQYEGFHRGVARYLGDPERRESWRNALVCKTEWGWESFETDAGLGKSHRLIDAEYHLGNRVVEVMRRRGLWWRPQARLRKTSLYGLADVGYYLSADGRESIRSRIVEQIVSALDDGSDDGSDDASTEVSCTLVGHSAGSVIALDLFGDLRAGGQLVEDREGLRAKVDQLERQAAKQRAELGPTGMLTKMKVGVFDSLAAAKRLLRLSDLVESGRLKAERLITLGSPNTFLALRSDDAVEALAYSQPMSPALWGFEESGDDGAGPRWINVWDIRDPISFPVEPIFAETPLVADVHVATSARFWRSHTEYWRSKAVHRAVAALL